MSSFAARSHAIPQTTAVFKLPLPEWSCLSALSHASSCHVNVITFEARGGSDNAAHWTRQKAMYQVDVARVFEPQGSLTASASGVGREDKNGRWPRDGRARSTLRKGRGKVRRQNGTGGHMGRGVQIPSRGTLPPGVNSPYPLQRTKAEVPNLWAQYCKRVLEWQEGMSGPARGPALISRLQHTELLGPSKVCVSRAFAKMERGATTGTSPEIQVQSASASVGVIRLWLPPRDSALLPPPPSPRRSLTNTAGSRTVPVSLRVIRRSCALALLKLLLQSLSALEAWMRAAEKLARRA